MTIESDRLRADLLASMTAPIADYSSASNSVIVFRVGKLLTKCIARVAVCPLGEQG
jgi:hypothetical protein